MVFQKEKGEVSLNKNFVAISSSCYADRFDKLLIAIVVTNCRNIAGLDAMRRRENLTGGVEEWKTVLLCDSISQSEMRKYSPEP
jgi:hypothetical protein